MLDNGLYFYKIHTTMLEILKDKFKDIMRYIKKTGKIRKENIQEAMKKIKIALLEADVNYKVVKEFLKQVETKALGEKVLKSVTPFQQFIKIVEDEIINLIKVEHQISKILPTNRLNKIMVSGLNGSGKTTTAIKLAKYFKNNKNLIIAADLYRPAAIEQLLQMGKKNNIDIFYLKDEKNVLKVIKKGIQYAQENKYNLVITDTAGRMEVDHDLMDELAKIYRNLEPDYSLLVTDAMTGQMVVDVVNKFKEYINIDGAILSKFDSDVRGGIALSLKFLTKVEILFLGTGEKVKDLELFEGEKIAKKILGMADITGFVEKAQETLDKKQIEKLSKKIISSEFDMNMFLEQLKTVQNSGMLNNLVEYLPVNLPVSQIHIDSKDFKKIEAIILSMTEKERKDPDMIDLSRKLRIAKGLGRPVEEITGLIKSFKEMKRKLKKFRNLNIHSLKGHPLFKKFL